MKWEFFHEFPKRELELCEQTELAKVEALQVIACTLENIHTRLGELVTAAEALRPDPERLRAAREELENVMYLFEAELGARIPAQNREQFLTLLARARKLIRRDFP